MLEDIEGIRRTIALYSQLVDDRKLDEWTALYAIDGVHESGSGRLEGHAALREFIGRSIPGDRMVHVNSQPVIDVTGDKATATTDWVTFRLAPSGITIHAFGRYFDTLVRSGDRWVFAHRRNETRS